MANAPAGANNPPPAVRRRRRHNFRVRPRQAQQPHQHQHQPHDRSPQRHPSDAEPDNDDDDNPPPYNEELRPQRQPNNAPPIDVANRPARVAAAVQVVRNELALGSELLSHNDRLVQLVMADEQRLNVLDMQLDRLEAIDRILDNVGRGPAVVVVDLARQSRLMDDVEGRIERMEAAQPNGNGLGCLYAAIGLAGLGIAVTVCWSLWRRRFG